MKAIIIFFAVTLAANFSYAQNALKISLKNEETKQAVSDAEISAVTDQNGKAELKNVPGGEQTIQIFSVGYETQELKLIFPLADQSEREIFITVNNEIGEVTISSTTRVTAFSSTPKTSPTRARAVSETPFCRRIKIRFFRKFTRIPKAEFSTAA